MESDSTLVTGSPSGLRTPRVGDVLLERFELRELVERDALVLAFQGLDQETDGRVLVRVSAPGLLDEREAERVVQRLTPLVGSRGEAEGSVWPTLLEVDREGSLVCTVEPWPKGTSFAAVLDSRAAKEKRFTPAELVPLVSRMAAAIDGLEGDGALAGIFHGDLRPSRVFVHPDGMTLTGAFLLAVLPSDAVGEALRDEPALTATLPPEYREGPAGRPADRFFVARLAWEAIDGLPPSPSPRALAARPAPFGVLARYLAEDPSTRPPSLAPLVEALASSAGIAAQVEHERLVLARAGRAASAPEPPMSETGSYQLSADDLLPAGSGTTPGTDPRARDMDPALVRAAKAAAAISETGSFQLRDDELIPVSPASSSARASAAKPRVAPQPPTKKKKKGRAPRAGASRGLAPTSKDEPAPAARSSPAPHPAPHPTASAPASILVAGEAPRPRPRWEHPVLPSTGASLAPLAPSAASSSLPPSPLAIEAALRARARGDARSGLPLIVGAIVIALLIVGFSFWYRMREADLRHEQEIERRLQDLRR